MTEIEESDDLCTKTYFREYDTSVTEINALLSGGFKDIYSRFSKLALVVQKSDGDAQLPLMNIVGSISRTTVLAGSTLGKLDVAFGREAEDGGERGTRFGTGCV